MTSRLAEIQRSALGFVLVLVIFGALPLVVSSYQMSIANEILIFALLAMSIDVLAGYAGRTSLGHGALFGISTYVVPPLAILAGWLGAGHDRLGGVPALDQRHRGRERNSRCRPP